MSLAKNNTKILITIVALIIIIFIIASVFSFTQDETRKVRVGYINSWAEGSFPAIVMEKTSILENNSIVVDFISFQTGIPVIESALSNNIDVAFVGRVPGTSLVSRSDDWFFAGRLASFPIELMARTGTGINSINDLRGKKIGVPFATGPYALIVNALEENGINHEKDVTLVNLKPGDMALALQLGEVDAVSWGEPVLTVLEQKGLAYSLEVYDELGVIVMSKSFAEKNPEMARNFLKAFEESLFYISENKVQVFEWFSDSSQIDTEILNGIDFTEPNYSAKSIGDVNLIISGYWIAEAQKRTDLEVALGIYSKTISVEEKTDLSYLK